MKTLVLLAASMLAAPLAFANTNSKGKLYICTTPQPTDLDVDAFDLLTWVQIGSVGSVGETGQNTNILTYDTWDTEVIQKGKGITDAGSPEIELARVPADPGQIALRAAAATNQNYAFKIVKNDPATLVGDGTTMYNRGIVTGPRRPNGRNEDFDLEVYMLGLNQLEIVVDPT